jgi:hypothetical protein
MKAILILSILCFNSVFANYKDYNDCVKANGGPYFKIECNSCSCIPDSTVNVTMNGSYGCTEMACNSSNSLATNVFLTTLLVLLIKFLI